MTKELTATESPKMSVILSGNAAKTLSEALHLTKKQLEKANASALQLSSDIKLAKCDPYSILRYCYTIARYNFVRDDAVYPVPYNGKVQAQMGYQGFLELAMRSGKYHKIACVEVKNCDKIITNEDGEPEVIFCDDYVLRMNAPITGYYAYARLKGTKELVKSIYWTQEMVTKHAKTYSKSYDSETSSIWKKNPVEMAKKTLLKQLIKTLDISEAVNNAIMDDQLVFGGNNQANAYEDNPQSDIKSTRKTTVTNSILPEESVVVDNETGEVVNDK